MRKIFLWLLFIFTNQLCNAGVNGLTTHSRANCINNETISWDALHPHQLFTTSDHINAANGQLIHSLPTGWADTRRSAAVHWGEGVHGGWVVHGYHWIMTSKGPWRFADETVNDCSIYDGWWEMK